MLWIFAERFFMAALRQCEKSEGCFAVFTAQPWTAAVLFKLQFSDGLLGSLSLIADSLRLLPTKTEAKTEWSAREWSKNRQGWIFITSQPPEREALRPLHSLWIDMLVLRLLSAPKPEQHPVWF